MFYFGGGSTKLLLDRTIENHSTRSGADLEDVTIIDTDIERGLLRYKENMIDQVKKIKKTIEREEKEKKSSTMDDDIIFSMYT